MLVGAGIVFGVAGGGVDLLETHEGGGVEEGAVPAARVWLGDGVVAEAFLRKRGRSKNVCVVGDRMGGRCVSRGGVGGTGTERERTEIERQRDNKRAKFEAEQ